MTEPDTRLAGVCKALNQAGARYVLVGAAAMQLWGSTRATRDIDILIERTVENAKRVLSALERCGVLLAGEWLAEEVAAKPVTIIGDVPRVDIMTVAWSVHYPEAIRDAAVFEIEGVRIPTVSIDHLIASKRTGRLQDAADIEMLQTIKRLREEGEGEGWGRRGLPD
ncbi:MAG: nucleotidyltransferase [Gemmatimonadales bacterium]